MYLPNYIENIQDLPLQWQIQELDKMIKVCKVKFYEKERTPEERILLADIIEDVYRLKIMTNIEILKIKNKFSDN